MNASQSDPLWGAQSTLDHPLWSRPRTMEVQGKGRQTTGEVPLEWDQLLEEPERWDGLS